MPSAVKPNPAADKEVSTGAGSARKPVISNVPTKRSQLLVSSESCHNVKSKPVERSVVAAAKSSSVGSRSSQSQLVDKPLRQKVDLATPGAPAAAGTTTSGVVSARNPVVRNTRLKPHSSDSTKSDTCSNVKTATTSSAVTRLGNVKSTAHRKSVVEPGRHEDISVSTDKRKSASVAAYLTSNVKHDALSTRSTSSRVAAACKGKTSSAGSSSVTKKPQLKQANGKPLTTGRTSVKHGCASSTAVGQIGNKKGEADGSGKSPGGKSSAVPVGKLTELSSSSALEGSEVRNGQVTVANRQESLSPVDTSGSLPDECLVNESHKKVAEASDHLSHTNSESPSCELLRSQCNRDLVVPVTCADENGSDLDETSVCDISLNSCRSDCSTSLFHSACSSIIGSSADMKYPPLNGLLENGNLGMWSGSNSVSMESLQSSAGYCTPIEHDTVCEVADCTISNTEDTRYVYFLLLIPFALQHVQNSFHSFEWLNTLIINHDYLFENFSS